MNRREFINFASIVGVVGFSGLSLFAKEMEYRVYIDQTIVADENFDPDGWL